MKNRGLMQNLNTAGNLMITTIPTCEFSIFVKELNLIHLLKNRNIRLKTLKNESK